LNRYKQSDIDSENIDSLLTVYFPGTFTQWVKDNVDHNVEALDGRGTWHGIGILLFKLPKRMYRSLQCHK